jgi:hypothetical protein
MNTIATFTPLWKRPIAWVSRIAPEVERLKNFAAIFWMYRKHHTYGYAWRVAREIAFKGAPF